MENEITEEITYPFIIFKSADNLYCVSSEYVATIMQVPDYQQVPESIPEITGIFLNRDETVSMVDLRKMMKKKTLEEEYRDFCAMIDERKKDHVEWVETLEQSAKSGKKFMLATDPHKCRLGKWYYSFRSNNQEVNFHLHKIEDPHARLHQAALDVENCLQDCEGCRRSECLKEVLERVRNDNMPQILKLLDQTKDIFHSTVFHEMALVLNGQKKYAIIVDEVLAVETLPLLEKETKGHRFGLTGMISNVRRSETIQGLILELDVPALLRKLEIRTD